ncbi:hypothetical protein I4902_10730 [Proteus alimentorum]|uniref:Uncharacterized protein n=1 Tax=Proteus alimentorum TaxID=1973495 RepID=A0ABS0IUS6_9GAMM|nr:hypothetical protein [Proteus alimentorum]MBG2874323.1 hypothetical protein [Proteus alimentorum]MBG2879745.1 hypothetical protein [Proteus alimentorum]
MDKIKQKFHQQQQSLVDDIQKGIALNRDLSVLRELLLSYKCNGMTQDIMRDCLNQLRVIDDENTILDLLDFVEGFCSLEQKVYS